MFNHNKINTLIEKKQSIDKKITIGMMANGIGISLASLDNIKAGKNLPGVDTLEKIAIYFEKDMNYFFGESTSKEYTIPDPKPLVLNEHNAPYEKTDSTINKLLDKVFEQQTEITELRVELERSKNAYAPESNAKAG